MEGEAVVEDPVACRRERRKHRLALASLDEAHAVGKEVYESDGLPSRSDVREREPASAKDRFRDEHLEGSWGRTWMVMTVARVSRTAWRMAKSLQRSNKAMSVD